MRTLHQQTTQPISVGRIDEELAERRAAGKVAADLRAHCERVLALPLEYVPSADFERVRSRRQEQTLLAPLPARTQQEKGPSPPAGLPSYLASLYDVPLLTAEEEMHLFRKMNYLKYKARRLRDRLDPAAPDPRRLRQIEELYQAAVATRNQILCANLRLVVAIARRSGDWREPLLDRLSDGNFSLFRAVERFDYSRGFRFSTYAQGTILKNRAQIRFREGRRARRFSMPLDTLLWTTADRREGPAAVASVRSEQREEIARRLRCLNEREEQVIRHRYGLEDDRGPMTLAEMGKMLGLSREWIRQLEARAIAKLRRLAAREDGRARSSQEVGG